MSARDLVRALCTSVKRGKFEQWILDELSDVDETTFPIDKIFAELRHACGLPPSRLQFRQGGKNVGLSEEQAACLAKYLRRLLDLFDAQHLHVWYGDLLLHLVTPCLALSDDITELVQSLATKDMLMLKLLLEHYMRSPSAEAATILASVGDAQAEAFFVELNGYIAHPQTRLNALGLLNQVTKRQGPNLHKVATSGVFTTLLLCLKNDRDVMVVTHALVALTMLLPCLCSVVGPHLNDLFNVLLRLLQWRTLSSREDTDKTDFAVSDAMPIAVHPPPHAYDKQAPTPSMSVAVAGAHPHQPPLHLPLNLPIAQQQQQSAAMAGAGGDGAQHSRTQDKPAIHSGLAANITHTVDPMGMPAPMPDRAICQENRWMVLYETYPQELIHGSGYATLCQKLYGVLFVYFQHLYGTFPNNLFNFLHVHMQMDEYLRELLRPFLRSVRLNDVLVGMTAEQELDPQRWRKRDANDIVAECIWLSYGADDISVHSGSVDAANCLVDDIAKTYGGSVAGLCGRRPLSGSGRVPGRLDQGISPTTPLSDSSLAAGEALARAQQIGQDMMSAAPPAMGLFGAALDADRRPYCGAQLNSTPATPPSVNVPEYWGKAGSLDKTYSQSPLRQEPQHGASNGSDSGEKKHRSAQPSLSGDVHSVFPLPNGPAEETPTPTPRVGEGLNHHDHRHHRKEEVNAPRRLEDHAYLDKYTASHILIPATSKQRARQRNASESDPPLAPGRSSLDDHMHGSEGERAPAFAPTDRQLDLERQKHHFFAQASDVDQDHQRHEQSHSRQRKTSADVSADLELENTLMRTIHDLESQLEMIKAELVFEQYLKEQHIQRIRRLRRENMNIQAFQMEHTSMLVGLEKEFKALQATYSRLLDEHSRMERQHERWERDLQAKLRKYRSENVSLVARNTLLQEQHDVLESKMAEMRKQLESAHADIILLNNRCKEIASRGVVFKELEAQIRILQAEVESKDIQLEQYEEADKQRAQAETQELNNKFMLDSCQQETKYLKSALQAANSKLSEYSARIAHVQTQLDHKELAYKEQSKMLANVKGMSEQRLRAVEDKYDALKAVNYALETRMLDLYIARDTPAHSVRLSDNESRQKEYESKSRERTAPTTPVLENTGRPDSRQ